MAGPPTVTATRRSLLACGAARLTRSPRQLAAGLGMRRPAHIFGLQLVAVTLLLLLQTACMVVQPAAAMCNGRHLRCAKGRRQELALLQQQRVQGQAVAAAALWRHSSMARWGGGVAPAAARAASALQQLAARRPMQLEQGVVAASCRTSATLFWVPRTASCRVVAASAMPVVPDLLRPLQRRNSSSLPTLRGLRSALRTSRPTSESSSWRLQR